MFQISQFQGLDKKLIRTIMTIPLLSREEETLLAKEWKDKGNQKSLNKLRGCPR